ncbi:hypothetical protein Tco_1085769 [Tanacetum coccineum]
MAKLILNEARTEQYLAEPSIKRNAKYELGEELLKELSCNSYSRRVEEDAIGHIAKILEILDPIEVDEVGNNEGLMDEDISSNDDRDQTNSSMITKPEIKIGDEFLKILHDNSFNGMDGSDITEHIGKVLEITEWIKIPNVDRDKLRLHVFLKSLSGDAKKWWDNEGTATTWKEFNEKTCSDLFFKPYLDAQDGKDIYEIIDINYSPIPIHAHHDISNPDELCQIEEFTVVRYSVGSCEEYITVGTIRRPCSKEIDDMVYPEKRRVLNSYKAF